MSMPNNRTGLPRPDVAERNKTHGMTRHKFYYTWKGMISRCYNKKDKDFKNYGGRGIWVCREWKKTPVAFAGWCDAYGEIPRGHTLDRRKNSGPYAPWNCHFTSPANQLKNMRTNIIVHIKGEKLILMDAVRKYGAVDYYTAKGRIKRWGWNPAKAVVTPVSPSRRY